MLEDIGEDLIGNTFVLVSRYRYMSKDELAAEIDAIAQAAAELAGEAMPRWRRRRRRWR